MDLYQELLLKHILSLEGKDNISPEDFVHDTAYQALKQIKLILEDDQLDDSECFWRIEQIVRVFEDLGSNAGNRHEFG